MAKKTKTEQDVRDLVGDEGVDEALAELRAVKEEKVRRLEKEKCRFYVPNGKCEEFIKAVGSGEYFITLFSAANGVGKTQAGANVAANFVFPGMNDEWFNYSLFKNFPFPKRGRIVSDPGNIPNIVKALQTWFPKGKYKATKGGKDYLRLWDAGEWHFDVMSYEQDPKDFEAETLGFVWFDEPPTESIFKACVARLRMGGLMFITATMLRGSGWLYDKLIAGEMEVEGIDGEKIKRKVKHITAGVEDACIEHGVRGHLMHEDIQKMIAEYDEDEREARAYGKFQHLVGRIFKKFDRAIHVIPPRQINLRGYSVYELIDPHPRNPDAVLWLAVDRQGTKFVIDELWIKCQNGTDELAQRIKEKADRYRIEMRLGDPSMFIVNQHDKDGKSLGDRLDELGLGYSPAPKARDQADRCITDALAYTRMPTGEFIKAPELYVFDTCRRTIWELENYRWDEWTGKGADKHNAKEKAVDKDDHFVECLGRALIINPTFTEMPRQQDFGYQQENSSDQLDPYA
jgi:phage terminase large subunit-like protein